MLVLAVATTHRASQQTQSVTHRAPKCDTLTHCCEVDAGHGWQRGCGGLTRHGGNHKGLPLQAGPCGCQG
jgi:hypothetical protein